MLHPISSPSIYLASQPASTVNYFCERAFTYLPRPFFPSPIPAGFPSPAEDYVQSSLDLNSYLIQNPTATFFFSVCGHSMTHAHIHDGAIVAVDRSVTARHGHVVLAVVNGAYTIKRLYKRQGKIELHAENPEFSPITFKEGEELQIWGVVVGTIKKIPV